MQRAGFQAPRTCLGDERTYQCHGLGTAVSRGARANSVVHEQDGLWQELFFYPGEHLVRWVSSPVLGVCGPTNERKTVFAGDLLGRRRYQTPWGTPQVNRFIERR